MRPDRFVLPSPVFDQTLGLEEGAKDLPVEGLGHEPRVKRFDVALRVKGSPAL